MSGKKQGVVGNREGWKESWKESCGEGPAS